jgi:hypothetical protein
MPERHKTAIVVHETATTGHNTKPEVSFGSQAPAICRKRVTAMLFDLKFNQVNTIRITAGQY